MYYRPQGHTKNGEVIQGGIRMEIVDVAKINIQKALKKEGIINEDMLKALKRLNIDIEKSTGDLKSLNEILQEVANKFDEAEI